MSARDEGCGFDIVHRHAPERPPDALRRPFGIRCALRTFRVYVNETHNRRAEGTGIPVVLIEDLDIQAVRPPVAICSRGRALLSVYSSAYATVLKHFLSVLYINPLNLYTCFPCLCTPVYTGYGLV